MAEDPLQIVPWPLVLAGGSILVVWLFFRWRYDVFRDLGLNRAEMAILCLGPVAGLTVNIPVLQVGEGLLAVNLGGTLLPLLMVGLWVRRARLDPFLALAGAVIVSGVAKAIVSFDPETGIYTTFPALFAPSLVALAFAMAVSVHRPLRAVPLAYAAGSVGSLLGADLFNLGPLVEHLAAAEGPSVVSIGGAGVFDMVYLAGMVAMAGALVITATMLPRGRPTASGIGYPPPAPPPRDALATWRRFEALPDPNPREVAEAALALSDLHLRRRDFARSLRHSAMAVDALLADPRLLARVREDGGALQRDLEALQIAQHAPAPWQRRAAGNANRAAKLAVAALAPLAALPSRLEVDRP